MNKQAYSQESPVLVAFGDRTRDLQKHSDWHTAFVYLGCISKYFKPVKKSNLLSTFQCFIVFNIVAFACGFILFSFVIAGNIHNYLIFVINSTVLTTYNFPLFRTSFAKYLPKCCDFTKAEKPWQNVLTFLFPLKEKEKNLVQHVGHEMSQCFCKVVILI